MAFSSDKTRQGAAGVSTGYEIPYSCRFNAADDAYLSRTQGTPTDGKKWVWSAWVKRGALSNAILIRGWTGGAYEETNEIRFTSNTLAVEQYKGSSGDNYYYWRLATDML
ncbi:MAG: hypothetical protein QF535_02810, partial [Anaerolineales bacterium]|nr:hypothetical protein [Anaerolineales bacterium]